MNTLRVFVSSTYLDLISERQVVSGALLRNNCLPLGMELFPSGPKQWEIIEENVRACDVYLLIAGSRYGSIDPETGQSWTEREWDLARDLGKPRCALVSMRPLDPSWPGSDEDNQRVEAFRLRVESELNPNWWRNETELLSGVLTSIADTRNRYPRLGLRPPFLGRKPDSPAVPASLERAGLLIATTDFYHGVPWADLIEGAQEIDIFFTYGRSWRRSLTGELRAWVRREGGRLRVVLPRLDPPFNTALDEIAKRAGQSAQRLRENVEEAFLTFAADGAAIWATDNAQMFASYRFDDVLVVSLYNHQRGQSEGVPTFVCERGGSLFQFLVDDFERVLEDRSATVRVW